VFLFLTEQGVFLIYFINHVANRCTCLTSLHHKVALNYHSRVKSNHQSSRKADKSNVLIILLPHLE